jgi:hypothetical protein
MASANEAKPSVRMLVEALERNAGEIVGCPEMIWTPEQLAQLEEALRRNTSVKEIGLTSDPTINMDTFFRYMNGLVPVVTAALCATGSTLEAIWFFGPENYNRPSIKITMNKLRVLRVVLGRYAGGVAIHAMTAMVLGVLAKNTASLDVYIEKGDLSGDNGLQIADIIWNKTRSSVMTFHTCCFDSVGLEAIARAVVLKRTVIMRAVGTNALSNAIKIEHQKLENWKTNMLAFAAGLHQRVGERPTLVSSLSEELVHEIFRVFYKR